MLLSLKLQIEAVCPRKLVLYQLSKSPIKQTGITPSLKLISQSACSIRAHPCHTTPVTGVETKVTPSEKLGLANWLMKSKSEPSSKLT